MTYNMSKVNKEKMFENVYLRENVRNVMGRARGR